MSFELTNGFMNFELYEEVEEYITNILTVEKYTDKNELYFYDLFITSNFY